MSSSAAPAAAPKIPPAAPPTRWFEVRKGHDWAKFEATSEVDAENKFNAHFGITGTQHRAEIKGCDKPAEGTPWHSGQQHKR